MNRRDAALLLARRYPGGIEAVASRMGKKADTLRKELTGIDGYKWGVDEEELLVHLCHSAKVADPLSPLTASLLNFGAVVLLLPETSDSDSPTFRCLAEAAQEFGSFMASAADALADGKVSANEMRNVEREFGELVSKGQHCLARMAAIHDAGKPAALRPVSSTHQEAQAQS